MAPKVQKIQIETCKKSETIHVALSIWDLTDSYNRHVSVTMISILENTQSKICFHLLYDKEESNKNPHVADENKLRYLTIGKKYNAEIIFHHIEIPKTALQNKILELYTPASLLRLFIPDIITTIDKIIYLDTDITVVLDIKELWDIDISEYEVAAVVVPLRTTQSNRLMKIGINPNNYFNSGVMVFNLSLIHNEINSLSHAAFKFMNKNPNLQHPDQDVLNYIFSKSVYDLPQKFNYMTYLRGNYNYFEDKIIHYAGARKPWDVYTGGGDMYYWKYLLLSPWTSDTNDLFKYMLNAPNMERCLDVIPKWLEQKWPAELLPYLWKISVMIPCRVLWKDIKYLIIYRLLGKNPR